MMDDKVYPGGFYSLVREFDKKREPFGNWRELLPPTDIDVAPLFDRTVIGEGERQPRRRTTDIHEKVRDFRLLFAGQSEAQLQHGLLIVILRRRDPPQDARTLFFRLWSEHGAELVSTMSVRWMVSSATTFGDHGQTGAQRACGMGLSILFDTVKLYESERSVRGISGRKLYKQSASGKQPTMPLGLSRYSFKGGDLDKNMLARLWMMSEADPTIAPLAQAMLRLLVSDTRTIFSRLQRMKAERAEDPSGGTL